MIVDVGVHNLVGFVGVIYNKIAEICGMHDRTNQLSKNLCNSWNASIFVSERIKALLMTHFYDKQKNYLDDQDA